MSRREALPGLSLPRAAVAELVGFVAIARGGSVGRAAELLGRTQPSLSARLARLESAWGTRLFRRLARGMTLTAEGARLLPRVEAVLRDLAELDRAAGLPVAPPGELRIGSGDALGRELLPRALAALTRRIPGLEVSLLEGPGPRLLEALRDGEIDLALVAGPAAAGHVEAVDLEPALSSRIEVLTPRDHLGRRRGAVSLSRLAGERLVTLQPGSGFRRHLENAFAAARLRFRPAVEVGNLSLVRRFVAAGLGVAPVPAVAFSAREAPPGCDRRRLNGLQPVTYLRAVRAGAPLSEPTRDLLDELKGHSAFSSNK